LSTQAESELLRLKHSRYEIERNAEFAQLRAQFPLQAYLLLTFFSFAADALEALSLRGDIQAAQSSVIKMEDVFTWLKNTSAPLIDKELADLFGILVRADMPMEQVAGVLLKRSKKGKGAPVSNRLPVLQAVEHQMQHPEMSWMRLANKFCQCGKQKHDLKCRDRLRLQAKKLNERLAAWGVDKSLISLPGK